LWSGRRFGCLASAVAFPALAPASPSLPAVRIPGRCAAVALASRLGGVFFARLLVAFVVGLFFLFFFFFFFFFLFFFFFSLINQL